MIQITTGAIVRIQFDFLKVTYYSLPKDFPLLLYHHIAFSDQDTFQIDFIL